MINRLHAGDLWRFCATVAVEVLNPLLLISLALFVSVGYILTLLMPVNVDMWASLLIVCTLLPAIPLSLRARAIWRNEARSSERPAWRALLPLAPLLVLAPVLIVQLALPSLNSIAHVDLYFSYIIQAFHGSTPLQNIFVPGYPVNHYWLYYALIASIVRLTSVDTYTVFNLVNFAFLLSGLLWLARTILALKLAKPNTLYLGILVIFVFGAVNAGGALSVFSHVVEGSYEPGSFRMPLLGGADRRLHSIFPKVYHASGMTPGIAAVTAVLFACVKTLQERVEILSLALISAGGIAALGVMPVLILFIVCVLLASLALTAVSMWFITSRRIGGAPEVPWLTGARLNSSALAVWLAGSLLLSIPLLRYVDEFTSHYQSGASFSLFDPVNVAMTFAASVLLLPLAALQVAAVLRSPNSTNCFLAYSSVIGILLSLCITMPDQNQYKLQFLLAMVLALSGLTVVEARDRTAKSKISAIFRIYVAGLIVLGLINSAYGLYAVIDRTVRSYGTVSFDSIHVLSTFKYGRRLSAYYWIRSNTPPNAIVIVPRAHTTQSMLFHERLNYVKERQYYFAADIAAYDKRIAELHTFFEPSTPPRVYKSLVESMKSELPGRPFYAVVKYSELDPAQMRERGAKAVFDSPADKVAVYLLNPP